MAALAAYAGEDFAAFYAGGTDGGLFDGNASISLDYGADNWTFSVLAAYTDALDDDVLLAPQAADFWGGISLGFTF